MEAMGSPEDRLTTGVPGLDAILGGGYLPCRHVLVAGGAGTGKTALGTQYLAAGLETGQRCLLISLGEPTARSLADAGTRGTKMDGVACLDLNPTADYFTAQRTYDIFSPAEVERGPITSAITDKVLAFRPQRIFIDSLEQFRYLSPEIGRAHV